MILTGNTMLSLSPSKSVAITWKLSVKSLLLSAWSTGAASVKL
ncbi:Uncharacterised protein [Vibrio cholerae]|nr:Uncharacterised protein [Vibrio cholerae]CSI66890.1 Uncharacterised protein [Vibrio cholerae]